MTATATPPPDTRVVETDGELAVGITEPNPTFARRPEQPVPEGFARWRDALNAMRPSYYRLVIDWPSVSSPDGADIDLAKQQPGCMRDIPPCGGWGGVRDQLHTIAAQQKASGGERWQVLVVISGTPEGLARGPGGCERGGTLPRSRPPTELGVSVYRKLIVRLFDEARAAGAELRYWSPWNEPNHPYFISPQRRRCSADAPSAAVAPYAELARALQQELDTEPGRQELVLGELAGLLERKAGYTSVTDFVRELPRALVCRTRVFSQHGYVGGPDPVDDAARALRRHRCKRSHSIWITETGAGRPRSGEERETSGRAQRRACRSMRKRLKRWYEDPRVSAAFQYTLREDDRFPTGLVTTDLSDAYPALREWQAWGGDRLPYEKPPKSRC